LDSALLNHLSPSRLIFHFFFLSFFLSPEFICPSMTKSKSGKKWFPQGATKHWHTDFLSYKKSENQSIVPDQEEEEEAEDSLITRSRMKGIESDPLLDLAYDDSLIGRTTSGEISLLLQPKKIKEIRVIRKVTRTVSNSSSSSSSVGQEIHSGFYSQDYSNSPSSSSGYSTQADSPLEIGISLDDISLETRRPFGYSEDASVMSVDDF
jgi:hypothetical protein